MPDQSVETEARLEALVEQLLRDRSNALTPLGAGLLAASVSGYCSDSHTFSKKLGVEHALVIRECMQLADQMGVIQIDDTNERTQRLKYSLTTAGLTMVETAS